MLGIFARTFMTASRFDLSEPKRERWEPVSRAREEARLERLLTDERLR